MNIEEIIKEYLVANKLDGLVNTESECWCRMKDLMPCGEPSLNCCLPAKAVKCTTHCDHEIDDNSNTHLATSSQPKKRS